MKLVGANQAAKVTALEELPGKTNYFVGNDPKRWRTDVPTYGKVKYEGVYPGIDLIYYGNQRQLEYDFVVAPGADPKAITLEIENRNSKIEARQSKIQKPILSAAKGRKSKIDSNGDLVVEAEGGEVRFHKPVVYQPIVDAANPKSKIQNRKLLDGRYILTADNRVQFEIAGYDTTKPLVIDPVLVYSTYLGGNDDDHGDAIAVDSSGNAYVAGYTVSGNFPWTNSFGGPGCEFGCNDWAFVTKINASGNSFAYSAIVSASSVTGIAIDSAGSAYLVGSGFPTTPGAFQTMSCVNCYTVSVAKLSAAGNQLIYGAFISDNQGSATDFPGGIAVDSSGSAVITGYTFDTGFPTANAIQSQCRSCQVPGQFQSANAFVTKLNSTGSALVFSTYLGGNADGEGSGIAVDSTGNIYATGYTKAADFPTTAGAFQTRCGGGATSGSICHADAYVTKFSPSGSLVYSTYLGGSNDDQGNAIAVDSSGNTYVTGTRGRPTSRRLTPSRPT